MAETQKHTQAQKSKVVILRDTDVTNKDRIDPFKFDYVTNKMRTFFRDIAGFTEVHTGHIMSILAACEDPTTIKTVDYGKKYPLPQTGQMNLEHFLLKHPHAKGFFCVSTSYRFEPNPVPGRHDLIFPMFEFEMHGTMEDMMKLEAELLQYLGYELPSDGTSDSDLAYPGGDYKDVAKHYDTLELEHEHETRLWEDYGPVYFIKAFPEYTSPFWNMARSEDRKYARKVDVILSGQETIGSAERSCDPDQMRHDFKTIMGGMYAKTIYNHFENERVDAEMEEFCTNSFMPRSGGGIGITRMMRSMELEGLIPDDVLALSAGP